jgi:Uma2 family endonuclease
MKSAESPEPIRWTRAQYYKMADIGLFDGRRVHLIKGEVFEMSPQYSLHATGVTLADNVMRRLFKRGYVVRVQLPLDLGADSDPEPDIAVVAGNSRAYRDAHPTTAALIVEIADSSLEHDRRHKGSLYASEGIEDYWIVNLVDRRLEIYRRPQADATQPYGFGYADVRILKGREKVSPLAAPRSQVRVAELLP